MLDEPKGFYASNTSMTGETCVDYCDGLGYNYAGTGKELVQLLFAKADFSAEYGQECFCGVGLKSSVVSTPDDCNQPCTGNSSQSCGDEDRISVYASATSPVTNPGVNGYRPLGCWSDTVENRTLDFQVQIQGGCRNMSVDACTSTCHDLGFSLAGLEYGGGMS